MDGTKTSFVHKQGDTKDAFLLWSPMSYGVDSNGVTAKCMRIESITTMKKNNHVKRGLSHAKSNKTGEDRH